LEFPLAAAVQEAAATRLLVAIPQTLLIVEIAWPVLSRRRTVLGEHVSRKTSMILIAVVIVSTVLPALFFFAT